MKKVFAGIVVGALALVPVVALAENGRTLDIVRLVQRLNGSPTYLQSISASSTSARNSTAFDGGQIVTIVNDGSTKVYCKGTSSSGTAVAQQAMPIAADEKYVLTLKADQTHIACITSSGTSTVLLYKME